VNLGDFLTVVKQSKLEHLNLGDMYRPAQLEVLIANIPSLKLLSLQFEITVQNVHMMKLALIKAVEQNTTLDSIIVESRENDFFNPHEKQKLDSYSKRNEYLSSPLSMPQESWLKLLQVAKNMSVLTLAQVLKNLGGNIGQS
jgi:hypothetical protein